MRAIARLILALLVVGVIFTGFGITGIIDNSKPVISYETLTEDQVKKGAVISGEIKSNLGAVAEEYSTRNGIKTGSSSYYYAILVGNKVMAFKTSSFKSRLDEQARRAVDVLNEVADRLEQDDDADDSSTKNSKKKNSKKNKKKDAAQKEAEEEAALQEQVEEQMAVRFKGKVSKLDDDIERYLRESLTLDGESEPFLEIIPYAVSATMMSMKNAVSFLAAGIGCLLIAVLIFVKLRR